MKLIIIINVYNKNMSDSLDYTANLDFCAGYMDFLVKKGCISPWLISGV